MKLIKAEEIKRCQYCDTPNGSSTDEKSGKEFCILVHYWKSSSLLYCIASYLSKAPLMAEPLRSAARALRPLRRNRFRERQRKNRDRLFYRSADRTEGESALGPTNYY